ncbi:MAG: hypothetical protein ABIP54_01720 [Candidatus Andersenbacteria bacterium]
MDRANRTVVAKAVKKYHREKKEDALMRLHRLTNCTITLLIVACIPTFFVIANGKSETVAIALVFSFVGMILSFWLMIFVSDKILAKIASPEHISQQQDEIKHLSDSYERLLVIGLCEAIVEEDMFRIEQLLYMLHDCQCSFAHTVSQDFRSLFRRH